MKDDHRVLSKKVEEMEAVRAAERAEMKRLREGALEMGMLTQQADEDDKRIKALNEATAKGEAKVEEGRLKLAAAMEAIEERDKHNIDLEGQVRFMEKKLEGLEADVISLHTVKKAANAAREERDRAVQLISDISLERKEERAEFDRRSFKYSSETSTLSALMEELSFKLKTAVAAKLAALNDYEGARRQLAQNTGSVEEARMAQVRHS
jgi:hypothetical protein